MSSSSGMPLVVCCASVRIRTCPCFGHRCCLANDKRLTVTVTTRNGKRPSYFYSQIVFNVSPPSPSQASVFSVGGLSREALLLAKICLFDRVRFGSRKVNADFARGVVDGGCSIYIGRRV